MRKRRMFGFDTQRWCDRVDDTLDDVDVERIVADAVELAQTIVEAAVEPMIDAMTELSRTMRSARRAGAHRWAADDRDW